MRIRDFKVKIWLLLSFSIILTLVVTIGLVAYFQANTLEGRVKTLYSHPLQVRRAMDNLKLDIAEQRINTRDLIFEDDPENQQKIVARTAILGEDIKLNFDVIKEFYLGPSLDISSTYDAFIIWDTLRKENFHTILNGNIKEVIESISSGGTEALRRDDLYSKIKIIDVFAQKKADELYLSSIIYHFT